MRASLYNRKPQTVWDFMNEMSSVFDEAFPAATRQREWPVAFQPAVDIEETNDFYLMSFDLPGVTKEQVKIDVHESQLTVSGERLREQKSTQEGFRQFERAYGKFERRFQLPTKVDTDKIQARYENGVLEIMVPKVELAKPKTIKIESGGNLFSRLIGKSESTKDEH